MSDLKKDGKDEGNFFVFVLKTLIIMIVTYHFQLQNMFIGSLELQIKY
jgi:hypothetical protein